MIVQSRTADKDEVKRLARGRWGEVLKHCLPWLDVDKLERHQGQPCPSCGGEDRFYSYQDFNETGAVGCRNCFKARNGDGFAALQHFMQCDFPEAVEMVASIVGGGYQPPSNGNGEKPSKSYATVEDAAEALAHGRKVEAVYQYTRADGKPAAAVVRIKDGDGKTFRQLRPVGGGWVARSANNLPLYRLPELDRTQPVWIVEGEKAADAAVKMGLNATTSAGGSNGTGKTDWTTLAGCKVIIWPDNDEAGEGYADAVVKRLADECEVSIVRPPTDIAKADAYDWLKAHSKPAEALRALQQVEREVVSERQPQDDPQHSAAQPFPTSLLPEPLRKFVDSAAAHYNVEESMIGLPVLVAAASAIGSTHRVEINPDFHLPAVVWGVTIAYSGTCKSAPFRECFRVHRDKDIEYERENKQSQEEYRKAQDKCKKKSKDGSKASQPDKPTMRTATISDATVQSLRDVFKDNPRGVVLVRPELSGWVMDLNRFNNGGGDAAAYLEMFDGETITITRATGDERMIRIRDPYLSIGGTIQPKVMLECLRSHISNGLAARMLVAWPMPRKKVLHQGGIGENEKDAYQEAIKKLFGLERGGDSPVDVKLSDGAFKLFSAYYQDTSEEVVAEHLQDNSGYAAALAKLEAYAAKFALIFHLTEEDKAGEISEEQMSRAIQLAGWFKAEARRVYAMFSGEFTDTDSKLLEFVRERGGATVRDVYQGFYPYKNKREEAEKALRQLVKAGYLVSEKARRTEKFKVNGSR